MGRPDRHRVGGMSLTRKKTTWFSAAQHREAQRLITDALEADRAIQREFIREQILDELRTGALAQTLRRERAQAEASPRMSLAEARFEAQLGGQLPGAGT